MGRTGIHAVRLMIVCAASAASTAVACGESLYRVGKGVTYREYTAPLPGNILIVAADENERLLADALARAGHHVEVIDTAAQVHDRVDGDRFDIVMSRFELSATVESGIDGVDIDYLPVARHDTTEIDQLRARYKRPLADDDNIKRFLIAIHRTLKSRQA